MQTQKSEMVTMENITISSISITTSYSERANMLRLLISLAYVHNS